MKPLRLSLQAFGSYGGEMSVDFARLSRHGIFAISGPTGAGKSTIFDALVYALYGDLPGFRVDGNVRSQYAADDVETRVRLELEARGERWVVERSPAQLVRRRRGHGDPIERKATVVVERLGADGTPVPGSATSRKADVKDRIDELVGLTKAQFEQVVLIPQGRFEEVLKAETSQRAALLRRLFPVDVYGRVTEVLKAMADDRKAAYAEASRALDDLVTRLGSSLADALKAAGEEPDIDFSVPGALEVDDMARHLARLSSARVSLERMVARARAEADRAARDHENARIEAAAWDRWQADMTCARRFEAEEAADSEEAVALDRARRVADLEYALRSWEEASRELARRTPELEVLRSRILGGLAELGRDTDAACLGEDGGAARLAERLRHEAEVLRDEITAFDRLCAVRQELDARASDLAGRRSAAAERAQELAEARRTVDALVVEVEELERLARDLGALQTGVEVLEAERSLCERRSAAAAELERASAARDEAAGTAAKALFRLDEVRIAWRGGLAGRLAELLVDGDPCPTCGAVDHPSPAASPLDAPDDDALAEAESASEEAQQVLRVAEARRATALGAVGALGVCDRLRPLEEIDAELAARRDQLDACRRASERLASERVTVEQRRTALVSGETALDTEARQIDVTAAALAADEGGYERAVAEHERRHGAARLPVDRLELLATMASDLDRLARLLAAVERARAAERQCRSLLTPLLGELGLDDPGGLSLCRRTPEELAAGAAALQARADARAAVRHRIAEYEAAGASLLRPDVDALELVAEGARARHLALVGRQAVMEDNAGFFAAGPSMLETATKEVDAARRALEQARTMADRCAGAGGGASPTRLSLENWVLADYLRQVLVQANERLATMTAGRFALQLSDGVTDGRKAWGLDLAAFDAYTGLVRPATTLSGGETFMAALALALGLADVVSGGSNRTMGALFVDEGFGSLDAQALDSVVDVLRSLEDGGRLVGVVSHVDAVHQALPSGISVRATPGGSVAEVHYPPE